MLFGMTFFTMRAQRRSVDGGRIVQAAQSVAQASTKERHQAG
jgi:hypothetical protein